MKARSLRQITGLIKINLSGLGAFYRAVTSGRKYEFKARNKLKTVLDQVVDDADYTIISRRDSEGAVVKKPR